MKNYIFLLIANLSIPQIYSQNSTDFIIPVSLSENANAIVKEHTEKIELKSQQKMVHQISRKIIVLNEKGKNYVNAYLYYDDDCVVKNLEAKIYNMSGLELKKITKKDFKDVAVDDGFSLQLEGRVKYLEYTPTSYPYMMHFTSAYETTNTAFFPKWKPFDNYNVSIEKSSIEINYDATLGFRFLEKNFDGYVILKETSANNVKYELRDLPAQKTEPYGISSSENFPEVMFAVNKFHLKGVDGYATTWNELGAWFYEKLYKTQTDLSPETIIKIKALTENAKTTIEKAQIVYKYVQDKTRYISIQLGIGGWKPMPAKDVDRLGYGDCKALTNYTHSLLKVAGVESYLTIIQSDYNKIGLEKNFPSLQGNHMILCIPSEENIFLECTSQKIPFGYIGQSNEDRDVLIVTPEGGKMVKTNKYKTQENLLKTYANVIVDNQGNAKTELSRVFFGSQLDYRRNVVTMDSKEKEDYYKEVWDYYNGLKILKINSNQNNSNVSWEEKFEIDIDKFATILGNRMVLNLNVFSRNVDLPDKVRNRKQPLKLKRGYIDTDEITIEIPHNYQIELLPETTQLINKFGSYEASVKQEQNKLIYTRKFQLNEGTFNKEDYTPFRDFMVEVIKLDNSKASLIIK